MRFGMMTSLECGWTSMGARLGRATKDGEASLTEEKWELPQIHMELHRVSGFGLV